MFEGLKDMGKLMAQAKEMKKKMAEVQEELKRTRVDGEAAGGRVKVVVTGEMDCVELVIDPAFQSDPKLSQELIKAFNTATKKAKDLAAKQLSAVSGGLKLPGF